MGKGLYKTLKYICNCLLEVVYPMPQSCSVCGRPLKNEGHYLCMACLSKIKFIDNIESSEALGLQIKNTDIELAFDEWISVCVYEGAGREMIHKLKYKDKREVALAIASLMEAELGKRGLRYDIIVPVPLSAKKLKKRGYNQSELIGGELSNISGMPHKLALSKPRDTSSQVLYNAEERWYNVKDAFFCNTIFKGDTVLLVDDVITTGATAHYCAEELKSKGASRVYVISFAKAAL